MVDLPLASSSDFASFETLPPTAPALQRGHELQSSSAATQKYLSMRDKTTHPDTAVLYDSILLPCHKRVLAHELFGHDAVAIGHNLKVLLA